MLKNRHIWAFGEQCKFRRVRGLESQNVLGICYKEEKRDADLEGVPLWMTVISEMGHKMFNETALHQVICYEVEEIIVESMAKMMIKSADFQ